MTNECNLNFEDESKSCESPRKKLVTLQNVGNAVLGIGFLGSMGTLSYIAIDSTKLASEVTLAYPEIDSQLREWEFSDVSQLIVKVRQNKFSFTTLLVKVPEDSDVVGKLLPTNCVGTYRYVQNEIIVDEVIVCEDNETIPYVLGGHENV